MSQFKGGPKAAAEMLSGLAPLERAKVLDKIALQDPQMAELLKKCMITLEDLRYLTVQMLSELLREIDLKDLGLALKIASQELKDHILSNISKGMQEEINDVLVGQPQPISKVNEATEKIMEIVRLKADKGELNFNKDGETLV
ncbi:MAG: hypothetical protein HN509_17275 [Halobacteriovoraceae bacterium]|nr:hypothetical protein [Halobacteriovoraceae bacterium]